MDSTAARCCNMVLAVLTGRAVVSLPVAMSKLPKQMDEEDVWRPVLPAEDADPLQGENHQQSSSHLPFSNWTGDEPSDGLHLGYRTTIWTDRLRSTLRIDPEAKPALLVGFFALGIIGYFHLPREPFLPALSLALAVLLWLFIRSRSDGHLKIAGLATIGSLLLAGAIVAQTQVNRANTPMLAEAVTVDIGATVLFSELRSDGRQRVDLLVHSAARTDWTTVPKRVRLTSRQSDLLPAGSYVQGRARLMPHTGPAYPGGYDFGFAHFFEGRGALGFSLGELVLADRPQSADLGLMARLHIQQSKVRSALARRIRNSLPGEAGHVAVALITGERQAISDETNENLRASGLAHILAISGLHMTLIVGSVFFGLRFLIARHPRWSLHYPVKKIAAVAALVFATAYLAISGGGLATQRAYITLAAMLAALLLDRRAISLRNVAVAAAVVLVMQPHAIFLAGFQMSFAAVASLVACYRTWGRARDHADRLRDSGLPLNRRHATLVRWFSTSTPKSNESLVKRAAVWAIRFFMGLAVTSLIAGVATGLFAAWHFHRIAPMGLLANLLAMPFVSTAVMPGILGSMLALPFGLDPPMLAFAGWGIDRVRDVAQWSSGLGPSGRVGVLHHAIFGLGLTALGLAICIRGAAKLLAIPFLFAALVLPASGLLVVERPEVLVSGDARLIAIRSTDGTYHFNSNRAQSFTRGIWLRAFAAEVEPDAPVKQMACDSNGCFGETLNGLKVGWAKTPEALREDCAKVDLLISTLEKPVACKANILSRASLTKTGAMVVTGVADRQDFTLTGANEPHERPWNRLTKIEFQPRSAQLVMSGD
ncbi:MAG: ComEC/Rec2 family competence protein [Pseudomonadota bacterium]